MTTTATDDIAIAFWSSASASTYTSPGGWTERADVNTTGISSSIGEKIQTSIGSTGTATGTSTVTARVAGLQAAFKVDNVAPTATMTDPGSPVTGTITLQTSAASDTDSYVAQVQFQRSPAGAGTWTNVGSADTTSPYSVSFDTSTVSDGLYDFRAVATDGAGNTGNSATISSRRLDNNAPSSTTSFPSAGGSYNTAGWNSGCGTNGFCGTYTDGANGSGVQKVEISIRRNTGNYWNGSSFGSGSEVWNTTSLSGGNWSYTFPASSFPADDTYTIRVRATDNVSLAETPSSRSFTYDTSAPDTSITANPADPTQSTSASFSFTSTEGSSTFECQLDGGGYSSCTSPKSYAGPVSDGSHTFLVRATDAAGNTDGSAASYTWSIDTAAPSSTVSFPGSGSSYNASGWNAGCATNGYCGTYSDATSGVQKVEISIRQGAGNYWSAGSFSSGSEVWNTTSLSAGNWSYTFPASNFPADGTYTIRVRTTDNAGNAESPSSRSFTIDRAAPDTTIDSNPSNPSTSPNASFSFSSTEGSSTFECQIDGGGYSSCTSPKSYTGLSEGSHTFLVRATDLAGNTDGTAASYTWTVDTVAPSSTTTFSASGGAYNASGWNAGCGTIGFCGTYSDAISGVQKVEISILQGSNNYWNGTSFGSAGEVWNTTSLAGGNWSYAFSAASFPADGSYTIRVKATDNATNAETPSSRTFTYDSTAPAGSLTAPAEGAVIFGASVTVSSDSADGGSGVALATFERRPAGGGSWTTIGTDASAPYSASWDTTSVSDGDYDLRVTTDDDAGNSFSSATRTVTVDNTDPASATLDALPGAIRNSQTLTGSGTDAGSGVASLTYYYCAGSPCSPSTPIGTSANGPSYSVAWTSQPADGEYQVLVRVSDRAGHALDSSKQSVTIDNTDPSGSLTAPGDDALVSGASVTVSSDSADSGSSVASAAFESRPSGGGAWTPIGTDISAPYSVSWDTSALNGDFDLRVVTTDVAGNTHASAAVPVTVDNTPPDAPTITLAESSPWAFVSGTEIYLNTAESGTYDVSATSSDAESGIEKIRFPGPVDDTSSPYGTTYGFGDLSGSQSVTAYSGVGLTASDTFTVTPDTVGPDGFSLTGPGAGAAITNGETISASPSDGGSGIDQVEFRYCTGSSCSFPDGTAIGADSTVPYSVSWNGQPADGTYTIVARATDNVGNTTASTERTVTVDNTGPTSVLSLNKGTRPDLQYFDSATDTYYYNPAATGDFSLSDAASDPAGVQSVDFPAIADTGFTGPATTDGTAPYDSGSYTFTAASASTPGSQTVVVTDTLGNATNDSFDIVRDANAPSGGSVSYVDGYDVDGDVTVTTADGNDSGAGVDASAGVLERRTAALTNGSCAGFSGGWTTATSPDAVTSGLCAQYRYRVFDNVGNEAIYTSPDVVEVDLTAPDNPVLTLSESSPWAFVSGTQIYLNTAESGSYDVDASASDAESDIDHVSFPGSQDDAASPYQASYSFGDLAGPQDVTAQNNAGLGSQSTFTVTADTTSPAGGSVSYSDGYDADAQITIATADGNDPLSGVDGSSGVLERRTSVLTNDSCAGFPGGWTAVTSPDTVGTDTCAQYRYRVSDNVGNEATYTSTNIVKVDQSAPDTSIDSSPSDPTAATGASFDFSSTEGGSTFECELDGGGFSSCSSPQSYAGLSGGSHTFEVRATDVAGNTDATPASFSWTVDTTAPDTSIDSSPSDPTGATGASFDFSSTEGGSTFECELDGGGFSSCSSPQSYAGLSGGSHTFEVRATDVAGNTDATPASFSWTVDTTAPDTSIDSSPSDPTGATGASFDFSSTEGGSTFECELDGGGFSSCSSPQSYSSLIDGTHTFKVRATDEVGNTDATPASFTWFVDAGPPSISIGSPNGSVNLTTADPFTITATSPDGDIASVEFFECTDSSSDCSTGTWTPLGAADTTAPYTASWSVPADGNASLRAIATDVGSNTGEDVINVTVDRTRPDSNIDSAPADPTNATDADFDFSANESGVSFQCQLDGGTYGACSSPQSYNGLADGSHTFDVRATDVAGNVEAVPQSFTWTVDTTAPETSITGGPSDPSSSSNADFSFDSTENDSTFECELDGGGFSACTSPASLTGLAVGSHTFKVKATDTTGNTDGSAASFTWTISATDLTAPTTPTSFEGKNAAGRLVLSWKPATDDSGLIDAYLVYVNGTVAKTVSGSTLSADMGAFSQRDARTFQVAARDAAGNASTKSVALVVVPKVTKLSLAKARAALKKRGLKSGKITYVRSSLPKGSVISAGKSGLVRRGSAIPLKVSKGKAR